MGHFTTIICIALQLILSGIIETATIDLFVYGDGICQRDPETYILNVGETLYFNVSPYATIQRARCQDPEIVNIFASEIVTPGFNLITFNNVNKSMSTELTCSFITLLNPIVCKVNLRVIDSITKITGFRAHGVMSREGSINNRTIHYKYRSAERLNLTCEGNTTGLHDYELRMIYKGKTFKPAQRLYGSTHLALKKIKLSHDDNMSNVTCVVRKISKPSHVISHFTIVLHNMATIETTTARSVTPSMLINETSQDRNDSSTWMIVSATLGCIIIIIAIGIGVLYCWIKKFIKPDTNRNYHENMIWNNRPQVPLPPQSSYYSYPLNLNWQTNTDNIAMAENNYYETNLPDGRHNNTEQNYYSDINPHVPETVRNEVLNETSSPTPEDHRATEDRNEGEYIHLMRSHKDSDKPNSYCYNNPLDIQT